VRHTAAHVTGWIDAAPWPHHRLLHSSTIDLYNAWESGNFVSTYPAANLPIGVEILLGGAWIDITNKVYYRDKINLTRGRTSERQTADAQQATMTLDNTDGRFSARNPNGIYYGQLGRNTPLRVFVSDPGAPWARQYRFYGEVGEWPLKWDTTGTDIYVPITAAGIFRRLGTGSAFRSAYFRGCTSAASPITLLQAYWPCEDGAISTQIAAGLSGVAAMTIVGAPVLATDSASFLCSDALPTMGTATFYGTVPNHTSTNNIQVRMLAAFPSGGITNNAVIFRVNASGTAGRYDVYYTTGGNLGVKVYDRGGTLLKDTGAIGFAVNGTAVRISLQASPSGGDIAITLATLVPGATSGGFWNDTVTSATVGISRTVAIAPQKDCSGLTAGHLTVQSTVTSIFTNDDQLRAYAGERAASRVARLCTEESIAYFSPENGSALMGAQGQKTLLELLRECEDADDGLLFESRDFLGVYYQARNNMSTQNADITFNYAAADLSTFEPVDDDQNIVNDVTTTRTGGFTASGGSSARFIITTGTLSTQAPPAGVGTYATNVEVNVQFDAQLIDQASWRAYLGTVDEARYPAIGVDFGRVNLAPSTTLNKQAVTVEISDRLVVTNPPAWLPPDSISQIIIGMAEQMDQRTRTLTYVCVPESPYRIGVYDNSSFNSRYDGTDSKLSGVHDSVTTTLIVASVSGTLWTIADGSFDIMVEGERMTVTNVVGGSSPQTFTVTRSVNGIVKTHNDCAAIVLFSPAHWSL